MNTATTSTAHGHTTLKPAPNWRRFCAMGYDSLILMAISMIYGGFITGISVAIYGTPTDTDYQPMFNSPLFAVGWLCSMMFFYMFFWRTKGQTVGMRAWRIKVIPAESNDVSLNISWQNGFLRALVGTFGLLLLGINYWYRWLTPTRDCLHDKLSNSKVVVVPKLNKKKK